MKPMVFDPPWWPEDLGHPSSTGSQNDLRYAFFPDRRRLLVDRGGTLTTYDSGDHLISGVSSQQSGQARSLAFSSQHGPVHLDDLSVVGPAKERETVAEPGQERAEGRIVQSQGQWQGQSSHAKAQTQAPHVQSHQAQGRAEVHAQGHAGDSVQDRRMDARFNTSKGPRETPAGERVVFNEETGPNASVKIVVVAAIDADMLDAIEDFVRRQRKRIAQPG